MKKRDIEAALGEAFAREVRAFPPRQPRSIEVERALAGKALRRWSPRRGGARSLIPALVFIALGFSLAWLSPNHVELRPLARVLSEGLPEDCGERFQSFLVIAGESLREMR